MKNILLIVITICTIACKAQVTHSTADVKSTLPNGSYKLTKEQVDAIPTLKLSQKPKTLYTAPYIYKSSDIFIGFFDVNRDSLTSDLHREKRFQDELYIALKGHGNNSYKSFIKNVGKNQVLLTSYTVNDTGYYRFYCQNEAKTLTQAGYINYPTAEAEKAAALLNEVLNSIQFTK